MLLAVLMVVLLVLLIVHLMRCEKCGSLRTTQDYSSHFDEHTQGRFTHQWKKCKKCGHVERSKEEWEHRSVSDRRF